MPINMGMNAPRGIDPLYTPQDILAAPLSTCAPISMHSWLMQVHVEAAWPPARPSTMRGALQLGVPPSGVLAELMGRATADADPPVTPVPYLVPLPMRHSLAVKRPDVMSEEAFGDLREDNLQLVIQVGGERWRLWGLWRGGEECRD